MPASPRNVTHFLLLLMSIVVSTGAGVIAIAPATAAQEGGQAPLDLAALILHSDDLNWLLEEQGLLVDDGYPYGMALSSNHTSIEDILAYEDYALGRGGFTLNLMGEDEAAGILDDAGWRGTQSEFLALPVPGTEDQWSLGVAVTIEEFATEDGAVAGLRAFDNEDVLAEIALASRPVRLDLPSGFDDATAVMWDYDSTRLAEGGMTEIVSMWVQVDTLVVSVALLHAPGYVTPDPDLLVPLVELQLKRLEHAEHLYQPGLSICVPQLGGDQVVEQRADYSVLNGVVFPSVHDTFDDITEAQQEIDDLGIVDVFVAGQSVDETTVGAYDGTLWFQGRTRTFIDEDRAEEYLASMDTQLEEAGYTGIEELADVPDAGDDAVAYTYVGTDGNAAAIISVLIGAEMFQIRIGSTTEPQIDAVFALAEEHLERVAEGDCGETLAVPRGL